MKAVKRMFKKGKNRAAEGVTDRQPAGSGPDDNVSPGPIAGPPSSEPPPTETSSNRQVVSEDMAASSSASQTSRPESTSTASTNPTSRVDRPGRDNAQGAENENVDRSLKTRNRSTGDTPQPQSLSSSSSTPSPSQSPDAAANSNQPVASHPHNNAAAPAGDINSRSTNTNVKTETGSDEIIITSADIATATPGNTKGTSVSSPDDYHGNDDDDDDVVDDKGVSPSFKGFSLTAQFDDNAPDVHHPDGIDKRMAKISHEYDSIPLIEQTKLPRGGISMETKAVGRIQYGIPPETIKDSMRLGIPVPQVYIVPAERFCREMGPALGVNLAEFEFPAYFNFFVYKKQCTLIVDSQDAEDNICRVFEETLLGPRQFRRKENPIPYEEEDFAPDFPREAIPNFEKELGFFRIMADGSELCLEKVLSFCHFKQPNDGNSHNHLGVPPNSGTMIDDEVVDDLVHEDFEEAIEEIRESENLEATTGRLGRDTLEEETAEGGDSKAQWSYARARWVGDVATVWPSMATEEQKKNRSVPRVEVFKMPSGTEYIIHDIDENNIIIGKARFSGHVKVSESMSVEGFGGKSILDDQDHSSNESFNQSTSPIIPRLPPSFYPPSFGVTILGNSHGFDASGSVSGYVLWINGRGVMIDPPPYSSATLEREGIRPRTIVGIILTHTHADHDAGAFQKVLTGSPVVVIATPTVYKSFIRKYAALASLSPALLRHSHRYKAAIIGQPLRFQGATFHFFYSLHAIPCVGFRVEWRGRSMVFSGDHMNKPDSIDKLQADGVLSKARADDLRNMPLQETDLLLHEAGAPPIHTPLEVLQKLPQRVKKRMYVVHTSNIPKEFSDLRVAPTGTAGTLRLCELRRGSGTVARVGVSTWVDRSITKSSKVPVSPEDDEGETTHWSSASNEYVSATEKPVAVEFEKATTYHEQQSLETSFSITHQGGRKTTGRSSILAGREPSIPLVSLRPASSTDAWFILNLLSAIPFLSSLSYSSTMEVLETARVDAYCKGEIVVPASRRHKLLCVIWEGTCIERNKKFEKLQLGESLALIDEDMEKSTDQCDAVWHAGDWTGPTVLQPEKRLSGESDSADQNDIVAISVEGVKVITIEFSALHSILKAGSALYPKYLERQVQKERVFTIEDAFQAGATNAATQKLLVEAKKTLNVVDLLDQNSALRKLSAVQKRHLESLAEGPIPFNPGDRLWRAGAPVDRAILVVSGTASFVHRRRNAGSASVPSAALLGSSIKSFSAPIDSRDGPICYVDEMQSDVEKAVKEMGDVTDRNSDDADAEEDHHIQLESLFSRSSGGRATNMTESYDFAKLSETLMQRAESLTGAHSGAPSEDVSVGSSIDCDSSLESGQKDLNLEDDADPANRDRRSSLIRRRSSKARFANKVLGRLYSRRAFTGGLVFSRGHFLGDVSKMVAGKLSSDVNASDNEGDQSFPKYGFGEKSEESKSNPAHIADLVIQENESVIVHTSTLTAGKDGCIVLVFPKATLIPFLDEYPGLLLSLLGTQVVV